MSDARVAICAGCDATLVVREPLVEVTGCPRCGKSVRVERTLEGVTVSVVWDEPTPPPKQAG